MLPTFTEFAGVKPVEPIDGISLPPTLLQQGKQKDHGFLFLSEALRMGDW